MKNLGAAADNQSSTATLNPAKASQQPVRSSQAALDVAQASARDKGDRSPRASARGKKDTTELVSLQMNRGAMSGANVISPEESGKLTRFKTIGRVVNGLKQQNTAANNNNRPIRDDDALFGNLVLVRQSPLSLIKMSKRILELRNEQIELGEVFDMGNSL